MAINFEEGGSWFGDQLLGRVTLVAPFLAAQVAGKAAVVLRTMRHLMGKGGVVAFSIVKALEGRYLHKVGLFGELRRR
jgi:hypothetical protein